MGRYALIVLDTHIFLWFILGDIKLEERLRLIIEGSPTEVVVPSIRILEALLLIEKGRLRLGSSNLVEKLDSYIKHSRFVKSHVTHEIHALSRTLPFSHEDPADRFIATTTFALKVKLATVDSRLRSLTWLRFA